MQQQNFINQIIGRLIGTNLMHGYFLGRWVMFSEIKDDYDAMGVYLMGGEL